MNSIIKQVLEKIEREHNVTILYACESGSRAWGFASKDSDYDVRFIYIHERDWYLGIDDQRDVIELPVNEVLDINGWDLRKTLRLFRKSNSPLYEWLQSPVIYMKNDQFYEEITALSRDYFLLRAGYHHYLNMAKNCFDNDLQGRVIKIKKYFYALRSVLACQWILNKRELPPMEFSVLRKLIHEELQSEIDILLELKEKGDEKLFTPIIPSIHQFLVEAIQFCVDRGMDLPEEQNHTEQLNSLFRTLLKK